MKKKAKKYSKKFVDYVKNKENFGKVLIGLIVLIVLVFTAIYILGTGNVSKIEEEKIKKESSQFLYFVEDISESKSKDVDKYIVFSLDYSYYNNNDADMTADEITQFLNTTFDLNTTKEKILSVGITEEMLAKNITYDGSKELFKISPAQVSSKKIEDVPITYYRMYKIRRNNKNTYTAKYDKYIIKNPYDMLNYYIDRNNNLNGEEPGAMYDTTTIRNYIVGSNSSKGVKELISKNEEDLKNYASKEGTLSITYVMNGEKLIIKDID